MEKTSQTIVLFVLYLQAAFVVVGTILIAVAYAVRRDKKLKHVVPIATAHCIFTVMAVTALDWGIYPFFSLRGIFAFIAFLLTNYALGYLVFNNALPRLFPDRFEGK